MNNSPVPPIDWLRLAAILDGADRLVLTSHARPDADALGSALGLAALLEARGKRVTIVNPSAAPENLGFLDPTGRAEVYGRTIDADRVEDCDVHVVLDTSAWAQLGEVGKTLKRTSAKKVVLDHHVSSDSLDAEEFKDPTADATGSLVIRFADAVGWDLPPEAATPLYAAIATDTGWFRFPSTRPETVEFAARLMRLGADQTEIYRQLYERRSEARMRLVGRALGRIAVSDDGRIAYAVATRADFTETGAKQSDTENLVNECLAIDGVRAAFMAVEQGNGSTKLSLRGREPVDVASVAEKFGGGGHRLAAGAVVDGPPDKVVPEVAAAMQAAAG
ncbi:MAG: bifunctional oligoribonuclease/PAP phosphatase NrnA [Planctomycetota bacterium]